MNWRFHRGLLATYVPLLALFIGAGKPVTADIPFRVASYNVLFFDSGDSGRTGYLQTVISEMEPDILMLQEMRTSGGPLMTGLLQGIAPDYAPTVINDGSAAYFRTGVVSFISFTAIQTDLRDITEYVFDVGGNEIRVYDCHLKASQGSENENRRLLELQSLHAHLSSLPTGTEYLVAGDMNLYTSSEPGYQYMTNDMNLVDLLSVAGPWHNNAAYAHVHTQSTRTTRFGGGATGGLDDRFDFILSSYEFNNNAGCEFLAGSYTSFGNDGNHFNVSIVMGANGVVSAAVANALHEASDHLPVYADFVSRTEPWTLATAIMFESNTVSLSWATLPMQSNYTVYSASSLLTNFTVNLSGTFVGTNTWFSPIPSDEVRRFYYVGPRN